MHRAQNATSRPSHPALLAALLTGLVASACSEAGTGGIIYQSQSTAVSAASNSILRVAERWLLFQADENTTGPTGTDLNGDTDKIDLVATVVDMASKKETNLGIAADDLAILGSGTTAQLFLVVTEGKDGTDWNTDGDTDDVVLLNIPANTAATATPVPVATLLAGERPFVLSDERLYFVEDVSAGPGLALGETAIQYVTADVPDVPVRVNHEIFAPGTVTLLVDELNQPQLVAADGGLVFFTMDETVEEPAGGGAPGVNLNGDLVGLLDADTTDQYVLGVVDAEDPAGLARGLGLAVSSASDPVRAIPTGTVAAPDKLLAFLVSEADQAGINFNEVGAPDLPGGWEPTQCIPTPDVDTEDTVLFYLEYQAWLADWSVAPDTVRAKNTGLAGGERVLATANGTKLFVATVSSELEAACDLNDDGDSDDEVLRWAPIGGGTSYVTVPKALLALEGVAGGVDGVSDLDERFVAVISESGNDEEFNGDVLGDPGYKSDDLLAWLNPGAVNNSTPTPWIFDHSPNPGIQAGGCDWMAERVERDRLLVSYLESVHGSSINTPRDNDTLDSIPSFARFDPIDDLDFPGPPVAARAGNIGTGIAKNVGYYRVDEDADNEDWNRDGDKDDMVLFRTTVSTLQNTNYVSVLNDLPRPAVELGGELGAAYVADETMANVDYNKDGDTSDLVVRWFRIG